MSEFKKPKVFVDGLFIKERTEKTSDFILASYSINIEQFKNFLDANQGYANKGWLNIDIKKSEKGTKYAELNTYKPEFKKDDRFNFKKPVRDESLPLIDVNDDVDVESIPF